MAGRSSEGEPVQPTNGALGRHQPDADTHTATGLHHTASELDQTLADGVQTSADYDQTAADRDQTDADRDQLASDLEQAASDQDQETAGANAATHDASREVRERTTRDRERAIADRAALVKQLATLETDELTGARVWAAGLRDLEREIERSDRTGSALVVAYVDVVGFKALNDSEGHTAGDLLLQHVVLSIRERLRAYDLVVRYGGDEFVCVVTSMDLEETRTRFAAVSAALADPPGPGALRVGFAQFEAGDGAADVIARADHDLLVNGAD